VSGGNPDLASEKRQIINLGANIAPFETIQLNLSADYTSTKVRDAVSALPPLNAAVQAAFSERFVRDPSGRLVEVDARLVSFARDSCAGGLHLATSYEKPSPAPPVGSVRRCQLRRVERTMADPCRAPLVAGS
jgi:hypothetical protein